jgi:Transposase, Mutator family
MEAYVHGVSTRAVDDLVEAMGADAGISKSEVSRICAALDEQAGAFRTRTLEHTKFPYVYLDATYLNVRNQTSQDLDGDGGGDRDRRRRLAGGPRPRRRRLRGRDVLSRLPHLLKQRACTGCGWSSHPSTPGS